jgi:hypothetical protein
MKKKGKIRIEHCAEEEAAYFMENKAQLEQKIITKFHSSFLFAFICISGCLNKKK